MPKLQLASGRSCLQVAHCLLHRRRQRFRRQWVGCGRWTAAGRLRSGRQPWRRVWLVLQGRLGGQAQEWVCMATQRRRYTVGSSNSTLESNLRRSNGQALGRHSGTVGGCWRPCTAHLTSATCSEASAIAALGDGWPSRTTPGPPPPQAGRNCGCGCWRSLGVSLIADQELSQALRNAGHLPCAR